MKLRIVLFLLAIIFAPGYTQGQATVATDQPLKNKVRIALRAGGYFSRFSFTPKFIAPIKGEDAIYGGIQLQIPLAKKIFISTEGLYAIASVSYNQVYPIDEMTFLLTPLMVKYQLGKLGLYAGGQANFLLNAKASFIDTVINKGQDVSDSSYKKVSYSAIIGAEYVFKYRFGIDIRYQQSISDINADNGSTIFTYARAVKMRAFQAGIFFRFGKKPKRTK